MRMSLKISILSRDSSEKLMAESISNTHRLGLVFQPLRLQGRGRHLPLLVLWITQFTASIAALALPPFYAVMVPHLYPNAPSWFAALVFAAPLATGAVLAPFWGKLGDKYGRLPVLVRAHLGLGITALWAANAKSAPEFLIALVFQGGLGGAYSAGRALLLEKIKSEQRAAALHAFELAPRIALVLGPVGASFVEGGSLDLFRWFAPVSFASALTLLISFRGTQPKLNPTKKPSDGSLNRFLPLKISLFSLHWGGAILAPYSIAWTLSQMETPAKGASLTSATLLHLLPSGLFLLSGFISPQFWENRFREASLRVLTQTLFFQALMLAAASASTSWLFLWSTRVGYALFFVYNWLCVHALLAKRISDDQLGRGMGELDAIQRYSALSGAAVAAFLWTWIPHGAFPVAAALFSIFPPILLLLLEKRVESC